MIEHKHKSANLATGMAVCKDKQTVYTRSYWAAAHVKQVATFVHLAGQFVYTFSNTSVLDFNRLQRNEAAASVQDR